MDQPTRKSRGAPLRPYQIDTVTAHMTKRFAGPFSREYLQELLDKVAQATTVADLPIEALDIPLFSRNMLRTLGIEKIDDLRTNIAWECDLDVWIVDRIQRARRRLNRMRKKEQ